MTWFPFSKKGIEYFGYCIYFLVSPDEYFRNIIAFQNIGVFKDFILFKIK